MFQTPAKAVRPQQGASLRLAARPAARFSSLPATKFREERNQMSSPVVGMGTNITSNCFSEADIWWTGTASNSGSSDWIPPVVWEHCGVQLLASYATGYPYQWGGSDFPYMPLVAGIYHRTADAVLKLRTGGKAAAGRQNLFCLTAVAAEVTNKFSYSSEWEDLDGIMHIYGPEGTVPIPPQDIAVCKLGHPGADNRLWTALPDNADVDVTPRVVNKNFYTFNVNQQKYIPQITANGTPLDPTMVSVTNCVGQKIVFKLQFAPPLPAGVLVATNNNWWLPPDYRNAYIWFQPDDVGLPIDNGTYYYSTCDPGTTNPAYPVVTLDH